MVAEPASQKYYKRGLLLQFKVRFSQIVIVPIVLYRRETMTFGKVDEQTLIVYKGKCSEG